MGCSVCYGDCTCTAKPPKKFEVGQIWDTKSKKRYKIITVDLPGEYSIGAYEAHLTTIYNISTFTKDGKFSVRGGMFYLDLDQQFIEPKTKTVQVSLWYRESDNYYGATQENPHRSKKDWEKHHPYLKLLSLKTITLTEGEFDE